jgi:hypothetical protein
VTRGTVLLKEAQPLEHLCVGRRAVREDADREAQPGDDAARHPTTIPSAERGGNPSMSGW